MLGARLYRSVWLMVVLVGGCATGAPSADTGVVATAVKVAQKMVGKPYRYGGSSPKGFDCSGLVQYSFTQAGHSVPRETRTLFARTKSIDVAKVRPGDLLFFRIDGAISHVAIVVDKDRFVHAPSSGKAVTYGSLKNPYWQSHFVKAGRL